MLVVRWQAQLVVRHRGPLAGEAVNDLRCLAAVCLQGFAELGFHRERGETAALADQVEQDTAEEVVQAPGGEPCEEVAGEVTEILDGE